MLENYKDFLKEFDSKIRILFQEQKEYIKCESGCSKCCKKGNYPFSQIEFTYITQGYINLPTNTKILVQQNFRKLLFDKKESKNKNLEHQCPFLINNKCCVYEYRGIICRTFGLCYYDEEKKYVRLPECVNEGLNYSKYYDKKTKTLNIKDVPMINLRVDKVLSSSLAKKYNIKLGEIRPILDWLNEI